MMLKRLLIFIAIVTVPFVAVMYQNTMNHEEMHMLIAEKAGCTAYDMKIMPFSGYFQCLRVGGNVEIKPETKVALDLQNEIQTYNTRGVIWAMYFSVLVLGGLLCVRL